MIADACYDQRKFAQFNKKRLLQNQHAVIARSRLAATTGSTSRSTLSTQQCPHVFSPQQACTPVPPPAARRTRRQRECTSGPGDRWRPMRQAAARERCTSAQLRRSNSRRRAHLGPVRGRGRRRGGLEVPAPPGEPGVGERREAVGAGPGSARERSCSHQARTTRVRRRARAHGGGARGCTERVLCDGVAHGCGGRSWGRGRLRAAGA